MIKKLSADGLIVHVNPMQEWLQPEGDIYQNAPVDIVKKVLDTFSFPIIVKEVGQGFGPKSMAALLQLPLAAIDFAANGGTNFSKLEMLRSSPYYYEMYRDLANVGHSSYEMVDMLNAILDDQGQRVQCKDVIISGGVKNYLDGYYLTQKSKANAVFGMASAFLKHAMDLEQLRTFTQMQIEGYKIASKMLTVK